MSVPPRVAPGVSVDTVFKVLNGEVQFSDATRLRVLAAAKQPGLSRTCWLAACIPARRRRRPADRRPSGALQRAWWSAAWRTRSAQARYNRFRQWRDAGVFEALLELVAEAAKRGEVDVSLVSIDSTTARSHHDAAGMHLDPCVLDALEKAPGGGAQVNGGGCEEQAGGRPTTVPGGKSGDASGAVANSD